LYTHKYHKDRATVKMDAILIDGGLGTELTSMGYNTVGVKFWSGVWLLEDPSVVKKAHLK
jgi:S-methylmethionine-dependent homocysteine/selenocysteine methylase